MSNRPSETAVYRPLEMSWDIRGNGREFVRIFYRASAAPKLEVHGAMEEMRWKVVILDLNL